MIYTSNKRILKKLVSKFDITVTGYGTLNKIIRELYLSVFNKFFEYYNSVWTAAYSGEGRLGFYVEEDYEIEYKGNVFQFEKIRLYHNIKEMKYDKTFNVIWDFISKNENKILRLLRTDLIEVCSAKELVETLTED